jgi:Type II restriction endonuclease EcoO109I
MAAKAARHSDDLVVDLVDPLPRVALVPEVQAILGVTRQQATAIAEAFDDFVAKPLEANFAQLKARDLAKRNPMIYTIRGTRTVDEWVDRVLDDKETSAIEGQIGTFLEEVARIMSGGIKPGSGVDLQIERDDGTVELYAIQTSGNTKNSGGRKTDVDALKRAARPLRASRRFVELKIAVLGGRSLTRPMPSEPDVTLVGSDDFWERITGIADFRSRLLKASVVFAPLIRTRAADEVTRIKEEASELFGGEAGDLNLDAVANPPKPSRQPTLLA